MKFYFFFLLLFFSCENEDTAQLYYEENKGRIDSLFSTLKSFNYVLSCSKMSNDEYRVVIKGDSAINYLHKDALRLLLIEKEHITERQEQLIFDGYFDQYSISGPYVFIHIYLKSYSFAYSDTIQSKEKIESPKNSKALSMTYISDHVYAITRNRFSD